MLRTNPSLTVRSACDCLFFRDPALTERFRVGFRAGANVQYQVYSDKRDWFPL